MAIAKKPVAASVPTPEQRAQTFIAGAHRQENADNKKPLATTLRFSAEFLKRIDQAAKRRNITRSAWIKSTLSQVLDEAGIE
jgi:hypothetical protein